MSATGTGSQAAEKTLICVVGPTASGKSALGLALAEHFATALIGADARQVYHGLRIGTNLPSNEERARVPHYLIDFVPLTTHYTAADYERDALNVLTRLFLEHNTVVLVGGTGFYLQALASGLPSLPEISPALREAVQQQLLQRGVWSFYDELRLGDPIGYAQLDLANPRRVTRAVEVLRASGKPFSSFRATPTPRPFRFLKVALNWPREELHARINQRAEQMLEEGLLEEVQNLLTEGFGPATKALQTIGYSEMLDHLAGKTSLATALANLQTNTRRYARRQLTWFRRDPAVTWFPPGDTAAVFEHLAAHGLVS